MNPPELGRLLRLKSAITALTGTQKVQPADAPSLAEGYRRMRAQVAEVVAGGELQEEFNAMFPELPEFPEGGPGRGDLLEWHTKATGAALEAQRLLDQLAGWVGGLVDEQTLPDRIQAEAAERVKQEKQGFEGV